METWMPPPESLSLAPEHPKIYHITHVSNLERIVEAGYLWSDARRIELGLDSESIGMSVIKQRRLDALPVKCHPETKVGQYIPFYFCPRSIMLFTLYCNNHPDIIYRGGQVPIVHLQADVRAVITWAESQSKPWAFTNRNAGARLTDFYNDLQHLSSINWSAVQAGDFRETSIKEGKQAEFLVHDFMPWTLIEKVDVINHDIARQAKEFLAPNHQPEIAIESEWYF